MDASFAFGLQRKFGTSSSWSGLRGWSIAHLVWIIAGLVAAQNAQASQLFGASGGCNGRVLSMAAGENGLVILGGDFTVCGDVPARGIVAYSPHERRFAAFGSGIEGTVRALYVEGADVYAGGDIYSAGGVDAKNLALWHQGQWQAIGSGQEQGVNGTVLALARYQDALYVAGEIDQAGTALASNIARWDGQQWSSPGGGVDGAVLTMTVYASELFVGGRFPNAGGSQVNHIARWNGAVWNGLGAGLPPSTDPRDAAVEVRNLAVVNDQLFATGYFGHVAVGQWRGDLQRWNGAELTRAVTDIGANDGISDINLRVSSSGPGGQHFVLSSHGLGVFNGSYIRRLELQPQSFPLLAMLGTAEQLLFSGDFSGVYQGAQLVETMGVAVFDGNNLGALIEPRVDGRVNAIAVSDEAIYVGGAFRRAGEIAARHIARWNGASWSALGEALSNGTDQAILSLHFSDGQLYAGGEFSEAGGVQARRIARWDGQHWQALGGGISGPVRVIEQYAGDLYAGGSFFDAGNSFVRHIARFDGQSWQPLGPAGAGVDFAFPPGPCNIGGCPYVPEVHALAEYRGVLYIGGWFNRSGGAPGLMQWDGQQLLAVPSTGALAGLRGVSDLLSFGDELYIADAGAGASAGQSSGCAGALIWDGQQARTFQDIVAADSPLRCAQRVENIEVVGDRIHLNGDFVAADQSVLRRSQASLAGTTLSAGNNGLAGRTAQATGVLSPVHLENPRLARSGSSLLVGDLPFAQFPPAFVASARSGQDGDAASSAPAVSLDGGTIAFVSNADNLAPGNPGHRRILLSEDRGRRMRAISDLIDGTLDYDRPSAADQAQVVAFESSAGQVHALWLNRPLLVSAAEDGAAGNDLSWGASVSPDGRQIAFASRATNLLGMDPNGSLADVHLKNLDDGGMTRIAIAADSANNGDSQDPALANHGIVAFSTRATAQTGGSGQSQIYYSAPTAQGRQGLFLSRNLQSGELGNRPSGKVRLSADGRFGAFESSADNLVADDHNGVSDVFWFQVEGQQLVDLRRVSVSSVGLAGNGPSHAPSISDDGQMISFASAASNLTELDRNGVDDIFLHLVATGETRRLNGTDNGLEADGPSQSPLISADGSTLVLVSTARNFRTDGQNSQVLRVELGPARRNDGFAATDEPQLQLATLPTPIPANPACPGGYYSAVIDDGDAPGVQRGIWGLELGLDPAGRRLLAGGLNFGSLLDAAQVAFAGVNIANAQNEPQRLKLRIFGHRADDLNAALDVQIRVNRRTADNSVNVATLSAQLRPDIAFEDAVVLAPGFYEILVALAQPVLAQVSGPAEGRVLVSATSEFLDRPGGGFQGGAVVGGYHDVIAPGYPSGFAGLCLPQEDRLSVRVLALPSYPDFGARDLRLRLMDVEQLPIYTR